MIWAFQKMNFDGLARLWDEIQQYRKGAFRGIPSPAVADRFVENQVAQLESTRDVDHLP
jgi:hypothetical protein